MKLFFHSLVWALVFAGCSQKKEPVSVAVTWGEANQPVITAKPGEGDPDLQVIEEQGYIHAKNRFLQMEVLRRASQGTLAYLFGEEALEKDRMVFGVGLVHAIEQTHEKIRQTPEYALLLAFAKGANRFIENLETEDRALLQRYRRLTGDPQGYPVPWHPIDSIAIGESVAFLLSSQLQEKMVYSILEIALLFDPQAVLDLIDTRPIDPISIVGGLNDTPWTERYEDFSWLGTGEAIPENPVASTPADFVSRKSDVMFDFPFRSPGVDGTPGSNNWVVNGKFAGDGRVYVSNDPHLPLTFPVSFYEMALNSKDAGGSFKVAGVNVPGVPGIMIGHNERIAWGFTNASRDIDDIYFEYLEDGQVVVDRNGAESVLEPIEEKVYRVGVRQNASRGRIEQQEIRVQFVKDHGPIFSPHIKIRDTRKDEDVTVQAILDEFFGEGHALSYKWQGHPGSTELVALLGLNRANNFKEFKSALQNFQIGSQNIIYGDVEGNIGFYGHGDFPVKAYMSPEVPPFMLIRGDKRYDWKGLQKEIPELYNPESGMIVTANNDHFGYNFDQNFTDPERYTSFRYAPGLRARRIHDLLIENQGAINAAKMAEIQYDHVDLLADRMLALVSQAVPEDLTDPAKALLTRLMAWDKDSSRDSVEATLFQVLMAEMSLQYNRDVYHYQAQMIDRPDLLSVGLEQFLSSSRAVAISSVYHRLREAIAKDLEAAQRFVKKAAEAAVDRLDARGLNQTRWGEVHVIQWANPLSGVLSMKPFTMERDGTWTTVDMAGYNTDALFKRDVHNFHLPSYLGPSFRMTMVLEPGKPITGQSVMPGGNVGDYDDLLSRKELRDWKEGRVRPLVGF